MMRLSVIVSTYNSPASLLKTLYGLAYQTYRPFEVLVADDGSGPETAESLRQAESETGLKVCHLWHEDRGFRKNSILNKAISASHNDYLVFLDGDCLPRADLIASHVAKARQNQVLSCGSQINIPQEAHRALTRAAIAAGLPFKAHWLAAHGVCVSKSPLSDKRLRLSCRPPLSGLLDLVLPRPGGFVGCNSSAWKADLLKVNGFDENITYGVDDKDLAIRLINAGVRARRLKYSLVYLHLEHPRAYADPEAIDRNKQLIRRRKMERVTWVDSGIDRSRTAA